MSDNTKQKQKKSQQKKPSSQEPPAHVKTLYEISKPKTNEIKISKEDQKLIDRLKQWIKETRGTEWPDEDIYRIVQEVKTPNKFEGAVQLILEG
jgi:ABC-type cobalamin transport system ATPase subunit